MVWQETVNLPTHVTIGSIPIISTNRIVNSVGRVPALHAGCREFESLTMHQIFQKAYMNYKPLHDKVLVIENEKPTETESGIFLGEARGDENTRAGTVLAVGPEVTEVKVGDVVYPMWTKSKVVKEGDKYMGIISQEDILAVEE